MGATVRGGGVCGGLRLLIIKLYADLFTAEQVKASPKARRQSRSMCIRHHFGPFFEGLGEGRDRFALHVCVCCWKVDMDVELYVHVECVRYPRHDVIGDGEGIIE